MWYTAAARQAGRRRAMDIWGSEHQSNRTRVAWLSCVSTYRPSIRTFDTKQYNCHANGGKGDGYHRYGEGQLIRLVHYLQPHCHKDKRNTGDECPHSRFPGPIRVSQECDDGKAAISYEAGAAVLQPRQDQNRETVHAGGCQEGASVQSEEVLGVPCGLIQTDQRIQPIPTEHRGGQGYRSITVKAEAHTRAHLVSCDES
mmetsp:Transcript_4216/g.10957  ORF Transcript_4216/g.10957 Transcript_4216/m.10957 type:complete len:200 (-) Transcript_4216:180-779(-)